MFKKTPLEKKGTMDRVFRLNAAVLASTLFVHALYGATQITTVDNTPHTTSTDGDIEVTQSGQINVSGVDEVAITIDSGSATITLDANNNNGSCGILNNFPHCALVANSGNGIDIPDGGGGNQAKINIGANTSVYGAVPAGINIESTSTTVNNAGIVGSDTYAIRIANGGTAANIVNAAGGLITNTANISVIHVEAEGATITNEGTIKPAGIFPSTDADAIRLLNNFVKVTNKSGGIINGDVANGINIASPISGDITNSGTITSKGGAGKAAINIGGAYMGTITNNAGGVIETTAGNKGDAILISGAFTSINNLAGGTIRALAGGVGDNAISIAATSSGKINNAGTIESEVLQAISIGASIDSITNTGTIKSTNLAGDSVIVVRVNTGITFANGIINSGNITDVSGTGLAIDLQTLGTNHIPLYHKGGTITGDVLLSSGGGTVLTMTGGTINGDIVAAKTNANTLYLDGGTVNGAVILGNAGDTVNMGGSHLQAVVGGAGNDIFNLSGGSFTSLDGNAGTNVINVNKSFTLTGTLDDIQTINVNNAGTVFNVKQAIPASVGVTEINIDGGATLRANANITGAALADINNDGTVQIYSNRTIAASDYTQTNGAIYSVQLPTDPLQAGLLDLNNSAMLHAGSYVSPFLVPGDFYTEFTTYDVLSAPTVSDDSTVLQPPSAILSFTKETVSCGGNECIRLTVQRAPYTAVALTPNTVAVASVLDAILPGITDADFIALFGQLDFFPSDQAVTDALEKLLPSFNYGVIEGSHISMDSAFDSAQQRLEDLRGLRPLWSVANLEERRDETFYNGTNYGDHPFGSGVNGAWAKLYGTSANQGTRNYVKGYNINATGIAIGGDRNLLDVATVGIAGSYTNTTVNNKAGRGSDGIKSYQATFYSWYHPYAPDDSFYIDAMVGVASHEYDTTRYISIGNLFKTATSTYYGMHYGAQMDAGYAFLSDDTYYVAPLVRVKYSYLDISDYTETGAGSLDLSVHNAPLKEFVVGGGFRFAMHKDYVQIFYVPEFSAMILYDFIGDQQQEVSNFLGGGSAFPTYGIDPAQTTYLFSFGVNAYSNDNYNVALKYNLELKDHFVGNTGFMKVEYRW